MAQGPLPLDGIRVLDLSGPVGSYGGRLLADAGADVVKVELPAGDELRRQGPFAGRQPGPERSLAFAYYHANKRGIVLDYRSPEALGMLAELGASADVVLVTPPVAGFDPDSRELSWAASDAVVCAITPFGLTGPYRSWRATHLTSCALGGGMYQYGPSEGPPLVLPGRQLYDHAGTHAAIAVLAALRARPAVGGQFIDISAHEVLGSSLYELHRYTNFQDIMRRRDRYYRSGRHVALPGRPGRVRRLDGEALGRLRPAAGQPARAQRSGPGRPGRQAAARRGDHGRRRAGHPGHEPRRVRGPRPGAQCAVLAGQHRGAVRPGPAAAQPRLFGAPAAGRPWGVRCAREAVRIRAAAARAVPAPGAPARRA